MEDTNLYRAAVPHHGRSEMTMDIQMSRKIRSGVAMWPCFARDDFMIFNSIPSNPACAERWPLQAILGDLGKNLDMV